MLTFLELLQASGTSWQPPSSPMFMFLHEESGAWTTMVHGNIVVGLDAQASDRGATTIEGINHVMGMASRPVAAESGWIGFRAMLSAEPLTQGDAGYPLLLQTGETLDGEPIHDAQHPHDLFMELAAVTRWFVTPEAGFELYVAPVGEPALGPPAFMHRVSAMSDPLAPLGHHWMDSTHITYGVLTAGVFGRAAKLEGSWFNGHEPDEDRTDLDLDVPDSASVRLSGLLGRDVAAQVSYGWLANPEPLHPGPVHRVTASATWNHPWSEGRSNVATTAAWGRNIEEEHGPTDSVLVETNVDPAGPLVVYGRASRDVKSARDLVVEDVPEDETFDLYTAVAGVAVLFPVASVVDAGMGVRGNLSVIPADLEVAYGTRTPAGVFVYVQIRPPATAAASPTHPHH